MDCITAPKEWQNSPVQQLQVRKLSKVSLRNLLVDSIHTFCTIGSCSFSICVELCKAQFDWDVGGEMTEELFVEGSLEFEQQEDVFEVHPDAIKVDVSGRDVTHFDNLDKALGLTRSSDLTYEDICAKVKPIDVARDKKVMESGFMEAFGEVLAKAAAKAGDNSLIIDEEGEDEKKVEEMKKRRSSLVQLERSMSKLSVGDTSEELKKSRRSLIKTGKIDEE